MTNIRSTSRRVQSVRSRQMCADPEERRTVKLKVKTINELKKQGMFGESYDDVIQRLLKVDNIKQNTTKPKWVEKI